MTAVARVVALLVIGFPRRGLRGIDPELKVASPVTVPSETVTEGAAST